MKKILVFGISNCLGGIESFFHNYFQYIDHKEYVFDFVAPEGKVVYQDDFEKNGSTIYPTSFYLKHPFRYIKEIKEIISKGEYDSVYVNMLSAANIMPLKIAKKNGVKNIIAHSHNADIPSNILRKVLHYLNVGKIKKYSNKLIACSDKAGRFLFKNNNFIIINNAIISENFEFSEIIRNEIRNKYSINEDITLIGHIGRFSEQKNQEFIVEIAKKMSKNNKIKFMLFGEGATKEYIIKEIKQYELEDKFIIMDSTKDVNKYYNAFDLFILPSRFEGLPVVGIEAQFNGLPCIFSDRITKELKYNSNVKFLDIDDVEKWVSEINKNQKRSHATSKLYEDFDIKNKAKDLEIIIDKGDE